MPSHKEVEPLKQMCFMLLAKDIHKICVKMELDHYSKCVNKEDLKRLISELPFIFVEQTISKVIETIHKTVERSRRSIGLQTCLEVLLQPHISRLDLSGLFFKMRLPVHINTTIRNIVGQNIILMKNLTYINLVSKCDDEILLAISENCKNILDIVINISDLVTDKGIKYIAKGCEYLERLEIYKCWGISIEGVKSALIHLKNLKELHYDNLGNVFLYHLKNIQKVFNLNHFEQTCQPFEPSTEEAIWVGKICPFIESVRLTIDDEFLFCLPSLGTLSEVLHQSHITLIGEMCKQLTSFHLVTATIDEDMYLKNNGDYFRNLSSLHLQIWKESSVRVECIDFFLLWCQKLSFIVIKAQMEFFTDSYLQRILLKNPLTNATKFLSPRKVSNGS
ncbi:hypothetical protein Avbf_01747 [Armadillidium vulgare]|nr:hypothetical protein Avbf_01747 [Armadillidium vulgare]